jgi:hypothetical protein
VEIFPEWHPDLNKKHFPRSADSEYVAVLAGQRSDGVIVPINVSLMDGTTNQYALAANTEISIPPITIGKVIVQGVDQYGNKHDILATPNPDGTWNLSLTSPTLALEASQLTQIGLMVQSLVLSSQQVAQMSNLITTVATEVTQLSVLHALSGLCINSPTLNQEVTQLSILQTMTGLSISVGDVDINTDQLEELNRIQTATIAEGLTNVLSLEAQEVTQLSDLQLRLATEETQLSIFQELSGLCVNLDSTSLAQEVTQLSILYDIEGLCFNFSSTTLSQEVTQLSVLGAIEGLSITTAAPHGRYYAVETTQAGGITDTEYDFGVRMQDVYMSVSQDVSVKWNVTTNPIIGLSKGQFDFDWQNADKVFVTTTLPTDIKIYANGGTT